MKNSIWDKMKGFATPYAADDNYDDYDDEMDDGFSEEEASAAPRYSRRSAFASDAGSDYEAPAAEQKPEPLGDSFSAPAATTYGSGSFSSNGSFSGHVMNGSASNKQQMVLSHPETFNDISGIAKNLCLKKAVVLNLEGVQHDVARRCVDFLSGCTFAVDGTVKKVADSTYMFCPNNMEVVGDLPSMQAEAESVI